jgi:signal transduction histidine kinase
LVALIRVSQRFNQLIQHSQSLASGHYSERLAVSGSDEIAQLSEHFNEMACAVEDRIDEVEKARHALIELNQTLESKVEQRTAQLHAQNKALDKALVHLKNTQDSLIQSEKMAGLGAMVAGVSHELNTPIGNALSVASSLNERTRGFIQETEQGLRKSSLISYRDYMTNAADLIERNLRRASDLITSFKHVAVDQTSSQCRKFNLKQTVHEILTTLAPSYKHTNHSIEDAIPTDLNLLGYPGPLGQVITNLVNNAMIHAFENCPQGNIHIQAQIFNDDYIKLTVTDNGKGISPENLSKVFDPFFTTKLGQGGSGLGLNIVHNMVTGLMQGKIEVSSELNQGTCFAITLPLMVKEIE